MSEFPAYKTAKVEDLIPYARNSRTHSDAQVDKIAASIKEFSFLNPVITDGDNGIVAGHGRIMAAKKLGMESVPVIEAKHLTEAQRRAYVIADNRLAEIADWDQDILKVELDDISQDIDLEILGFDVFDDKKPDTSYQQGETDFGYEWEGMPDFEPPEHEHCKIVFRFRNEDDLQRFAGLIGQDLRSTTKSAWYPEKPPQDQAAYRWQEVEDE